MLAAMPIPAAIVDESGVVLAVNRWLEHATGDQLLVPLSSGTDHTTNLRRGVDDSRWRVRPLDDRAAILLATAERLDAGDHLLRKFFASDHALFVVYDQSGCVIESNRAWASLLGYSHEEVFGLDSWTLLPDDDLATRAEVEDALRRNGRADPTFQMRTSSGEYRLIQWNLHFDYSVGHCFGIGRDITEEDRAASELERKAYTDELTGLANRARLVDRIDQLLTDNRHPALLYCDLDRFKVVNDSLGHTVGDSLLSALARRLEVSTGDHDDVTIARLGGDEFVVLIDEADHERAFRIAGKLLCSLKRPIIVDDRHIHASMSVGIAAAQDGSTTNELLSHADTAVYEAKRIGRGVAVTFDDSLQERVDRRFHVEAGLRKALDTGGIETFYQPLVDLHTGLIVGAEALVRWRNESGDIVGPGGFLDVAEDAGLLPAIGDRVAASAFDTASRVLTMNPGFSIAINTSQDELLTDGFSPQLAHAALSVGVSPERVVVEIVESAAISTSCALPVLEQLRENGFRIALDDFGTGFSSLAHLRDLPIDIVKVDRSFVASMTEDAIAKALTKSLLDLGSSLQLEVIMEGIETAEQEASALAIGGSLAQGYRYYKPMPQSEFLELMMIDEMSRAA